MCRRHPQKHSRVRRAQTYRAGRAKWWGFRAFARSHRRVRLRPVPNRAADRLSRPRLSPPRQRLRPQKRPRPNSHPSPHRPRRLRQRPQLRVHHHSRARIRHLRARLLHRLGHRLRRPLRHRVLSRHCDLPLRRSAMRHQRSGRLPQPSAGRRHCRSLPPEVPRLRRSIRFARRPNLSLRPYPAQRTPVSAPRAQHRLVPDCGCRRTRSRGTRSPRRGRNRPTTTARHKYHRAIRPRARQPAAHRNINPTRAMPVTASRREGRARRLWRRHQVAPRRSRRANSSRISHGA